MIRKIITGAIGIGLLSLLIVGCGPAYHISQAEKQLAKAERKGAEISKDTIYKTITQIVPRIKVDTVFSVKHDTVEITKERLKLKYIRVNDSIYINAECDTVILIRKIPVEVDRTVFKEVEVERKKTWKEKMLESFGYVGLVVVLIGAGIGVWKVRKLFSPL